MSWPRRSSCMAQSTRTPSDGEAPAVADDETSASRDGETPAGGDRFQRLPWSIALWAGVSPLLLAGSSAFSPVHYIQQLPCHLASPKVGKNPFNLRLDINGYFDASIGLPPKTDKLSSQYFTGYLAAVNATGQTVRSANEYQLGKTTFCPKSKLLP